MNNKGQIIITDMLLYLIILTVILGIIVYTTSTLNDNQVTRTNNKQIKNILEDTLSMLTKTSGTPANWQYLDTNDIKIIGLKSENSQLLNYNKLMKLKQNNQLLDELIPVNMDYSLTLYPKNNPNSKELIAGKEYLINKKQIQSKDTTVVLDYEYKTTSFTKDSNADTCSYNHDNQWSCKTITINETLLNHGKYYIVTDALTEYVLSNTYQDNITGQTKNKININQQLEQLKCNENQTIYIHIKTNTNNTCLVYDSNNREKYLDTVIRPEIYILNLKIAT